MGTDRFRQTVAKSPLANLISKYSQGAIIEILKGDHGDATIAAAELVVAAMAVCPLGEADSVTPEDSDAILAQAQQILDAGYDERGPLLNALHMLRELRPAWFSGPLYTELLAPFDKDLVGLIGCTAQDCFRLTMDVAERRETVARLPSAVLERIAINLKDIQTPGDLWPHCVVLFEQGHLVLPHKVCDTVYRALCRMLAETLPRFGTRKGTSLENFVERRVSRLAPSWSILQNVHISDREKDLLAWDDHSAMAIESKSLSFRPSSTDWSHRGLDRDVEDVRDGLAQVGPSVHLLREGGRTDDGHRVKPHKHVVGIVVTDEAYTGYVRAGIDRLDPSDEQGAWHGEDAWVCSFLDLDYIIQAAQTPTVLIHYLQTYRSRMSQRRADEPEAWSSYCQDFAQIGASRGLVYMVPEIHWEWRREKGIPHFGPNWLRRKEEVKRLDLAGRSLLARRILDQDIRKVERDYLTAQTPIDDAISPEEQRELMRKILAKSKRPDADLPGQRTRSI